MRAPDQLPAWLPPLVREQAQAELRKPGTAEQIAAVIRITSDPRMRGVWGYLAKRKRSGYRKTGDYAHAPYDPPYARSSGINRSAFPTRGDWLQQLAMRQLYLDAIDWGRMWTAPTSPRHPYHADADRLRAEVRFLENEPFGLSAATKHRLASLLRRTADAYADAANEARAKTREELPRYLVAMVTRRLHDLFGARMYGQAAVIAGLIMGCDVSVSTVRDCSGLCG